MTNRNADAPSDAGGKPIHGADEDTVIGVGNLMPVIDDIKPALSAALELPAAFICVIYAGGLDPDEEPFRVLFGKAIPKAITIPNFTGRMFVVNITHRHCFSEVDFGNGLSLASMTVEFGAS